MWLWLAWAAAVIPLACSTLSSATAAWNWLVSRQGGAVPNQEAMQIASRRAKDDVVVICFSGRGDKDCFEVARLQGEEIRPI